mmetsp:Transcript_847/g.2517  ORF Transcript_847/g.2517 Transcript_847/m.2517 type:complete len:288 (+) Transcript_847:2377-3240(+)
MLLDGLLDLPHCFLLVGGSHVLGRLDPLLDILLLHVEVDQSGLQLDAPRLRVVKLFVRLVELRHKVVGLVAFLTIVVVVVVVVVVVDSCFIIFSLASVVILVTAFVSFGVVFSIVVFIVLRTIAVHVILGNDVVSIFILAVSAYCCTASKHLCLTLRFSRGLAVLKLTSLRGEHDVLPANIGPLYPYLRVPEALAGNFIEVLFDIFSPFRSKHHIEDVAVRRVLDAFQYSLKHGHKCAKRLPESGVELFVGVAALIARYGRDDGGLAAVIDVKQTRKPLVYSRLVAD